MPQVSMKEYERVKSKLREVEGALEDERQVQQLCTPSLSIHMKESTAIARNTVLDSWFI